MNVKGNHPLAEIIARKTFSIETVPSVEARRMVQRTIHAAIEWHEKQLEKFDGVDVESIVKAYLTTHGWDGLAGDECGCPVDALMPCDAYPAECQPAYKSICDDEESEWFGEEIYTTEKPKV